MEDFDNAIKNPYDHRDTYRIRLILSAVALACFFLILWLVKTGQTAAIDEIVGAAVRSLRAPGRDGVVIFITNMGRWTTIVGIGIVLLVFNAAKWHKPDYPLAVGSCIFIAGALYPLLKYTVKRARPDEVFWIIAEHGYSFPSGHSMNSMFCYGMMIYLVWRNIENRTVRIVLTVLLSLLVLAIGLSRLYCGVHYVSDVAGGFTIGFSMLMLFTVIVDELILRIRMKNGAQ